MESRREPSKLGVFTASSPSDYYKVNNQNYPKKWFHGRVRQGEEPLPTTSRENRDSEFENRWK